MCILYATNYGNTFGLQYLKLIVKEREDDIIIEDLEQSEKGLISTNKKEFYTHIDKIVNESINIGNLHFFITINFKKCNKETLSEKELLDKIDYLNNIIASNIEL